MSDTHPGINRNRIEAALRAAGWPVSIGLNDKRHTSHLHMCLDGKTVHTLFTAGHGWFVYDPKLGAVTRGKNRDDALLGMVARRDSGPTGVCPIEKDGVQPTLGLSTVQGGLL
ncbi:MAG: hypothetical protein ACREQ4_04425 [Candidatus Binataceae bacterium]